MLLIYLHATAVRRSGRRLQTRERPGGNKGFGQETKSGAPDFISWPQTDLVTERALARNRSPELRTPVAGQRAARAQDRFRPATEVRSSGLQFLAIDRPGRSMGFGQELKSGAPDFDSWLGDNSGNGFQRRKSKYLACAAIVGWVDGLTLMVIFEGQDKRICHVTNWRCKTTS